MWPFYCLPKTSPWLSMYTELLWRVYLFFSLSRIEGMMTMLCFLASSFRNWIDSPSIDSENSTHGYRSRVHMKNGALKISCKQMMFAPSRAATSMISLVLSRMAHFCFFTDSFVGKTIWDWMAATLTLLCALNYSASDPILKFLTSIFFFWANSFVEFFKGTSSFLLP